MARLTYVDKIALNTNSSIPVQNKIQDTDMNNVKKSVNQIGMFTSATIQTGQPGKCYITMPGILGAGDTFKILFPTAVNPSANVQFSIDGGTTYYPVLSNYGLQVQGLDLSTKYKEIYFNGTNFILKDELKTILYYNATGDNGTISLSNSAKYYQFAEIYYQQENARKLYHKVYLPNNTVNNLGAFVPDSQGNTNFRSRSITISGNSITTTDGERYTSGYIFPNNACNSMKDNKIYIYSVIGIK